jgi:hypothetical protein
MRGVARLSTEELKEVSTAILGHDFDWIRKFYHRGSTYVRYSGHVDLCLLDAMQSEEGKISTELFMELRAIAVFRGWMTSFLYIQTVTQEEPWPAIDACKFWKNLSDGCFKLRRKEFDEYDDQYVYNKISAVNSDGLIAFYIEHGLVAYCLENAFVKSAQFLLTLQKITIKNPTDIEDDEGFRVTDVLFHTAMVRCIRPTKR